MKNIKINSILLIFLSFFLNSCSSDEGIKGYKASEILVVTVNIDEYIEIEKIVLDFKYSWGMGGYKHIYHSIKNNEITNNKTIKLKIPLKTLVGSSTICIYTSDGKNCTDAFTCGGGDRAEVTINNGTLNVIEKQRRFK